MRILAINTSNYGSTGKVMLHLRSLALLDPSVDYDVAYASSRSNRGMVVENSHPIGNRVERNAHILLAAITGLNGCFSFWGTWRLLRKIKKNPPDVIHLHNLHARYINIPLLFRYIKKKKIRVIWTFHDCWPFTGHCPHFDMIGCEKWKVQCFKCAQYRAYPASYVDNSRYMYRLKRKWFVGVEDMTIVTPSVWLSELVKQSFLKEYPVRVIHNGIDLSVFNPAESDFRERYALQEKHIILGVAAGWGERKGLDVFLEIAKRLPEEYRIVLVGTTEDIDLLLPENIISIHRTQDQNELAQIYSAADLFVNPTREENFPTVNMEALACGTPVLTFRTGGSPEIIDDTCGMAVEKNDIEALLRECVRICKTAPFSKEACRERAKAFDKDKCFSQYIALYHEKIGAEGES